MRKAVSLEDGTLYIQDADKQGWTAIIEGHQFKIGMDPKVHAIAKKGCKYLKYSYDLDKNVCEACHHPRNTPAGDSWGECTPMSCPLGDGTA